MVIYRFEKNEEVFPVVQRFLFLLCVLSLLGLQGCVHDPYYGPYDPYYDGRHYPRKQHKHPPQTKQSQKKQKKKASQPKKPQTVPPPVVRTPNGYREIPPPIVRTPNGYREVPPPIRY